MKNLLKKLSPFLVSAVISSGCAFSGRIIKKIHEPERSWIEIYTLNLYDGKNLYKGKIPIYVKDDEDFILRILDNKGRIRKFYLRSKGKFNSLKKGDYFNYDPKLVREDKLLKKRMSKLEYENKK